MKMFVTRLPRYALSLLLGLMLALTAGATIAAEDQTAADFTAQAKAKWQRTKVVILDADGNLVLDQQPSAEPKSLSPETLRNLAYVILIAAGILALFLFWKNRTGGGLFARRARDVSLTGVTDPMDEEFSADPSKSFSLDQLVALPDLREGLRSLLVQSLLRAADQNDVMLRRSFTARDILAKIPHNWPHWSALDNLVRHAEPVLFGDQMINPHQFSQMTENCRAMFGEAAGTGGAK